MKDILKTFGIGFAYAAGITAGFVVGTDIIGKKLCKVVDKFTTKKA